jgi:hypothetical protein
MATRTTKIRPASVLLLAVLLAMAATALLLPAQTRHRQSYLGFDRNEYPGDDRLPQLRQTFRYAGYWLNVPPGAAVNSWKGKRAKLQKHDFGFLLLFNGRLYRQLRASGNAATLGRVDGAAATASALAEGFRRGAVIFLDQEEGGLLLPEQFAYIEAWSDAVRAARFTPGVYCSGVPTRQDGKSVTTAADLRAKLGGKPVKLWVANDQCPPSPGCSYPKPVPDPAASGTADALVWQFAQSPRRQQFTAACKQSYAADGMCYAPGLPPGADSFVDLNSSNTPDPSNTR